jgi:hypothetical protein
VIESYKACAGLSSQRSMQSLLKRAQSICCAPGAKSSANTPRGSPPLSTRGQSTPRHRSTSGRNSCTGSNTPRGTKGAKQPVSARPSPESRKYAAGLEAWDLPGANDLATGASMQAIDPATTLVFQSSKLWNTLDADHQLCWEPMPACRSSV